MLYSFLQKNTKDKNKKRCKTPDIMRFLILKTFCLILFTLFNRH